MLIPLSLTPLGRLCEIWLEFWDRQLHDVKLSKEMKSQGTDGADINKAVTKGTVLIYTTVLIVLGIICEYSKYLKGRNIRPSK